MVILGIDPGLSSLGWGIVFKKNNRFIHQSHGVIKTKSTGTLEKRLEIIADELMAIIDTHKPQLAGIENLYFAKNVTSALPVAQARGVVLYVLQKKGIPISHFDPSTIKKSTTGVGNASKKQVQVMVQVLLKMPEIAKEDHAADALAIAICAGQQGVLFNHK